MELAKELDDISDRRRGSVVTPGFGALVMEGGDAIY